MIVTELPEKLPVLLTDWFEQNARPLPWRENCTPYSVWISEIMLQQTRIEAAKGYYARFLAALPDVSSLAAAPEEQVLKLWEGLGYYSRARNLHRAAKLVMEQYGGELPADAAKLRKLPGIGDYTAGAIASIAFGLPEPAVDGNVLRVCTRLSCCGDNIGDASVKRDLGESLRGMYPAGRCGAFTSALMELGEVICLPGTPECDSCPLSGCCKAFEGGTQTDYPVMPEKKPRRIQPKTILLLHCGGRYALRRRPDEGLLAGLWEFPNADAHLSEAQARRRAAQANCDPMDAVPCGTSVHIFTHLEWHMIGYRIECGTQAPGYIWATAQEIRERYALPTAFRVYKNFILTEGETIA